MREFGSREAGEFGQVSLFPLFVCLYSNTNVYMQYWSCLWTGIGRNGIVRGMRKLEWHIYEFGFCNGIPTTCENCNGINPIDP